MGAATRARLLGASSLQSRGRSSLPGDESGPWRRKGASGPAQYWSETLSSSKTLALWGLALGAVRPSRGAIRYAHPSGRTELRALLRSYSGLGTDSFSKLNCPQGNPVFPGLSFHRAFTPALLHYVSIFKTMILLPSWLGRVAIRKTPCPTASSSSIPINSLPGTSPRPLPS